jgi:nicotinate phosphoribosyltransferase
MSITGTYRTSLALLTDLYEITMAYGYWKCGVASREAVFAMFFRDHPFGGGYTIAAGLETAVEWMESLRFDDEDREYLAGLVGGDGKPLFDPMFLDDLSRLEFACDVDAVPEGRVVFPNEPLVRVKGPILQCQIVETALLNLINFQSLIATKTARIVDAAGPDPVIEFGLRRAQGIDGGLSASRAAYVGGCAATSNVLAGKLYGIPVRGTLAHSWIMAFDTEMEAFDAYAEAMPNNCVFLVDTYDSLEGVGHAIEAGRKLEARGYRMAGIRLDSGDLAYLSVEARRMLDAAGFDKAGIVASNNLDEHVISSLKAQGARIDTWGVGTHLVTAFDEPALGGVYKLTAVRDRNSDPWAYRLKVSEQLRKASVPGVLQVRRFRRGSEFVADAIFDEQMGPGDSRVIVHPAEAIRRKTIPRGTEEEDLLVPVFRSGRRVLPPASLGEIRERRRDDLAGFHPGVRRFVNPHEYPAGLAENLFDLRSRLILER